MMLWWWAGFYFTGRFLPCQAAGAGAAGAFALLLWRIAKAREARYPPGRLLSSPAARGWQALLVCMTGLLICRFAAGAMPDTRASAERSRAAGAEVSRSRAVRLLRGHVREVGAGRGLSCSSRGFISSLILADRSALDPELRERWRRLGIAHFLALSGLHLGIIVLPLYRLLALARLRGAPREAAIVAVVSLYAAAARTPVSLLRALALLCVVRCNRLCGRKIHHDQALCAGAFIVCLFEPRAASDPGFVLSVAATAGVILAGLPAGRLFRPDRGARAGRIAYWIAAALCVSCSAYLFTLPFSVAIFGRAPFAGPLLSIVMAPLFTVLLYALFFYICGGYMLGGVASRALNLIAAAVTAIPARVPSLGWPGIVRYDFNVYCYAAGLAVIASALARDTRRLKAALAGIVIICAAFTPPLAGMRRPATAPADTIAAGALLVGRERLLIIDGPLYDLRAVRIADRLWRRGVRRVDWTVVLDAGCASRSGIAQLAARCELRRILVSPWLLECRRHSRTGDDERLAPVTQELVIATEHGEYLVLPPEATPGSRAAVALREACLRIYPLD